MTTFDKREQAFENNFVHGEEIKFKATAMRNKMLGNWTAAQLGLAEDAAEAYAKELVTMELENQSDDDILRKVSKDLAQKNISVEVIRLKMEEFSRCALQQIQAGN
jgi:hypothetical protein